MRDRGHPDPSLSPSDIDPDLDPDEPVDGYRVGDGTGVRSIRVEIAVIAVGGVIGAEARYGVDQAMPHGAAEFPWSTLVVNASGCLLIGALMVVLLELSSPHRLLRPFLGVGLLGGYTTFSAFALDVDSLVRHDEIVTAATYVLVTVLACAVAVWSATVVTRVAGRVFVGQRT